MIRLFQQVYNIPGTLAANHTFASQIGRTPAQVLGRSGEQVLPGAIEQVRPIFERVRQTGRPFQGAAFPFEFEDQPERGTTYWDGTICPVYEPDGTFEGYLLIHKEVTDRVQTEEECDQLQTENQRQRRILEERG